MRLNSNVILKSYSLKKNCSEKLRSISVRSLYTPKRIAGRIASVSIVILLLVIVANAYTVIMLGGRRVEIPSRFVVTPATLTYEVAEGSQITIPMAAIDIAATEKANHEVPGSLLGRAKSVQPTVLKDGSEKQRGSVRRTITNRDLEMLKRRRLESETAYESKRKQLGLPSMEEQRKLASAELDSVTMELAQTRITKLESEHYWRGRATALRTEMAALDAELNYIRTRLDEVPFGTSLVGSSGSVSVGSLVGFGLGGNRHFGGRSFGSFGGRQPLHGQMTHRPNVYVAPNYGPQIRARVGFGNGATRGQVLVNPGRIRHSRQFGGAAFGVLPSVTIFGSPVQGYDFTYERGELITRFNELAAARAGLSARFRELEEEARRAGVAPGWLRP
jgi:hypothetical protein